MFVILHSGTTTSWKSSKLTLVAISTNHSEIITLYEASREIIWLHRMINHIQQSCGIGSIMKPIIIYEDNSTCICTKECKLYKGQYHKIKCS